MRYRFLLFLLFISAIPALAFGSPKPAYVWTRLSDGLMYATWSFAISEEERSTIHAFEIDPARFKIDIVRSKNEKEGSTARELAERDKAVLVINGGFFTPEHESIGLIIKDGRELNPIHKTSWWSVFAVGQNGPAIYTAKEFKEAKNIQTALQAGPRLVISGSIPRLKESVATRSAIGISDTRKIVIAITQGRGISMNELARRMSTSRFEGGLECRNAMALDGGSSSQLFAKIGKFELSLPGLARITNGIAVLPK